MKINCNRVANRFAVAALLTMPELAFASVESSMAALQDKLTGTILPLLSVLGLLFAGLAYLTGSPNARSYLGAAIIGAVIGFGAESIVSLIQSIVH
jgi:type IV secretory pathway VirB2 component (pilin)